MVYEGQFERLRQLGLAGGGDEDLRGLVERHSVLLGKLAGDDYIGGILFGLGAADVGRIMLARATSDLTLTTSAQSIVGDGDGSKVRLVLPSIGDWLITAVCDFSVSVAGPVFSVGWLYVNDSGTREDGQVILTDESVRGTPGQQWLITPASPNTPVELKALKSINAGTSKVLEPSTTIVAMRAR